jgi:hypothetical protein
MKTAAKDNYNGTTGRTAPLEILLYNWFISRKSCYLFQDSRDRGGEDSGKMLKKLQGFKDLTEII